MHWEFFSDLLTAHQTFPIPHVNCHNLILKTDSIVKAVSSWVMWTALIMMNHHHLMVETDPVVLFMLAGRSKENHENKHICCGIDKYSVIQF